MTRQEGGGGACRQRGLVLRASRLTPSRMSRMGADLSVVVGHAGTGNERDAGVAREAWEAAGYDVRGVALSACCRKRLKADRAYFPHHRQHGARLGTGPRPAHDPRGAGDRRGGHVGTRQLERVLSMPLRPAPRSMLVGDIKQLQSSKRARAFRSIHERHGRRGKSARCAATEDWQRDATRDLANPEPARAASLSLPRHGA